MAVVRLMRDAEIASITAQEREQLETIRIEITHELEKELKNQEECEVEEQAIETTCTSKWNDQIEEARQHFEGQKEIIREERDVELEHYRQDMDAKVADVKWQSNTQYEAIQQSRGQQLDILLTERKEECETEGVECTDTFDDQIEAELEATERDLERMRLELDDALRNITTNRTERVEELDNERQEKLDALREEWNISCTDQCTMCREIQEELLEAVHLEYEENISEARIHWDEQARVIETSWKDTMDSFKSQRQAYIDR